MDIYGWLTYRMSYLERPSKTIPWRALQSQFGCDYTRTRTFKQRFLEKTRQVLAFYPEARLTIRRSGLVLRPSPTHVSPKSTQFLVSHVFGSPPVGCQSLAHNKCGPSVASCGDGGLLSENPEKAGVAYADEFTVGTGGV